MLSIQAREYYKFVIDKLSEFQDNINDLTKFGEKIQNDKESLIRTILNNQHHSAEETSARTRAISNFINSFDKEINDFKQEFRPILFALEYQKLENEIKGYIKTESINPEEIENLFTHFRTFVAKVEHFYQNDSDANVRLELYDIITKICSEYNKIIDSYTWFIESLEETPRDYDEEKHMLLDIQLLGVEFGVVEFADKIKAIGELYENLAEIVPLEDTDSVEPLKIVKIESGSLCFVAIGNAVIAGLILEMIRRLADAKSSHYKSNKKLLSKKEVEKIIDEKLSEEGVDKSEDVRTTIIKKRFIEITSKFCTIKINNESYSYKGDDVTALPFFEEKLLKEGNDEE